MNKTDLLAALTAKYSYVHPPTPVEVFGPVQRYRVQCFDLSGDVLRLVGVDFYVRDEGQPTEAAYWGHRAPEAAADVNFQRDCEAYIATKITDNTIRYGFITDIDPVREIALAKAGVVAQSNLNEVKVMLRRQGGNITHTIINTVLFTGN